MNLDTRTIVDTLFSDFGPGRIGDGNISATGFQMVKFGNLKDTLKTVFPSLCMEDSREVLDSNTSASASTPAPRVAGIAYTEQQDFVVKHAGGYMIPTSGNIGGEMSIHFEKLLEEHGKNEHFSCHENDAPNFHLNREVKSEEVHNVRAAEQHYDKEGQESGNGDGKNNALVSPTKTQNRHAAPTGGDIEPVGGSHAETSKRRRTILRIFISHD